MITIEEARRLAKEQIKKDYAHKTAGFVSAELTVRDYFAAKALQGMLSTEQIQMVIGKTITQENVAGACYEWADAMLKARQA